MIRHAPAAAFPVVPLPVAVIEPAFRALLVPPVFSPASLAIIPVTPVTMTADPEHHATAGPPANPLTQELFAGPHPRPCGGTGQPRPVMAISIPSADDVGLFFRVGAKTPDRRLTAGFSLSDFGPTLPEPRQTSPMTTAQPLTIGAQPKKRGPLLSDGHERMQAMARKRKGLVPAGEAFGSLDGPVEALRESSPQALHHFTQADQVNQLVGASEANPDLGFMARLMALCSLPRTNPGDRLQYKRQNGPFKLVMVAGADNKLPFGNIPRLLMAWISTEAVRTQIRKLILGASLAEFMRKLDISNDSGGSRGERTRLRNQMDRLFSASVSLIYEDEHSKQFVTSPIAARGEFWWDPKRPDEPMLWESKIELGEKFFNEIIRHPVPLDMNILKALKRSSLGLDLYLWVAYRTFTLTHPLRLSWRQLYHQFGVDPAQAGDKNTVNNFRTKCLRELKKIKLAWPDLNYATGKGVLILSPSTPSVLPAQQLQLAK